MKKIAFYVIACALGVFVVVWPLAMIMSIFLFDAPFRNSSDAATRFSVLGAIFIFPFLYWRAWKRGKAALVDDYSTISILVPFVIPILSLAWIYYAFAVIGPRFYGK